MNFQKNKLNGCIVGISISESEDLESLGFDRFEINRCVVRLSELLLGLGARIAFGHDWRPNGVMDAIASLALRYNGLPKNLDIYSNRELPPIINRVAAPDKPFLRKENPLLPETLLSRNALYPPEWVLSQLIDAKQLKARGGTDRKKSLSHLRRVLAKECDVRICLGGRKIGYQGVAPGVAEEAIYSLQEKKPLYVSKLFGGASSTIVNFLSNEADFPYSDLFSKGCDTKSLIKFATTASGLNRREIKLLWNATSPDQCIELILRGILKWWGKRK